MRNPMNKDKAMHKNSEAIAALNDKFRRTFAGGRVMLTPGIASLPEAQRVEILQAVIGFESFDADDDPYGEHDFGAFDCQSQRVFWKIDYYDADLDGGSPDPADPAVTTRVLTVMLADEY
jgi:hypothetical protein